MANTTTIERRSEREFVITRMFNGPPRLVFEAWTTPELMKRWWAPKSLGVPLRACEMDVRVGGGYRLEFGHEADNAMAFYGKYLEVEPGAKLVWTNDEGADTAITTVTFEDKDGGTLLTVSELYPSQEALEANAGGEEGLPEQFEQLDELLAGLVT